MQNKIDRKHSYRFGFLKSEAWLTHRKIILAEQNTKCQVCNIKSWENDVHHIRYRRKLNLKYHSDFKVLCRRCHAVVHIVMEHRKVMGARDWSQQCWFNTRRSVKRILKRAKVDGLEAAVNVAKLNFSIILARRTENGLVGKQAPASQPGRHAIPDLGCSENGRVLRNTASDSQPEQP